MKKRKKTSNKRKIADRNPGFSTNALTVISIVSLVVISIIAYGNTLSSSFHLDDFPNIVDNYKIRDISNFFHVEGRRYFGYLSFAANYELSGLSVAGFHITNTAIHITNTLLVFALTLLLFKTPALQGKVSDNRLSIVAALFASAVFAAHPVNTQAVTYIVQRFTSLSTLFYLASITLFILTRLRVHTDIRTIALAIASTLMAVCAMMTKEISFTIPFMVILIELFFFGSIMRNKKRLILFIPLFLTVLIIPLSIIGLGKPTGDILGEISKASQETDLIGRGSYFLTELRVIVTYLRLFILPIEQNLDYDYVVRSGMDVPIFLSALLHVLLIGGAIYLFIRSKRSNSPFGLLASFGILWFYLALSVESSIIPIRDVIFEHRLYLPGVGLALSLVSLCAWIVTRRIRVPFKAIQTILIILSVVSLILVTSTITRNKVWKNDLTLYTDVIEKSPKKARGYNLLGIYFSNMGKNEKAMKLYEKSAELAPKYADAHNNIGNIYFNTGRFDDALKKYELVLSLKPEFAEGHNNYGAAMARKGDAKGAVKEFLRAVELKPFYFDANNNLGAIFAQTGELKKAEEVLRKTIKMGPERADPRFNLGVVLLRLGEKEEGKKELNEAKRLDPRYRSQVENALKILL